MLASEVRYMRRKRIRPHTNKHIVGGWIEVLEGSVQPERLAAFLAVHTWVSEQALFENGCWMNALYRAFKKASRVVGGKGRESKEMDRVRCGCLSGDVGLCLALGATSQCAVDHRVRNHIEKFRISYILHYTTSKEKKLITKKDLSQLSLTFIFFHKVT